MLKRPGLALAFALALLSLGPGSVRAQGPVSSLRSERSGFFVGFGFGPGTLSVEGPYGKASSGFGSMLRIGHAVNQNVLVGVSLNGWISAQSTGVFGTLLGAVHYYPSAANGFFLTGGVGVGGEFNGEGHGTGLGGLLGLGYDVRVGDNISLTPFVNGFTSTIEDSWNRRGPVSYDLGQIGVGVTFH